MKTFLKNYTSDVPVSRTIQRIEEVLIRCGVSGITKEYVGLNGDVSAVMFQIKLDPTQPPMTIRLPADKDAAQQALWMDYVGSDTLDASGQALSWHSHKKKKKSDFREQAERTAWRLIQDWIEIEMSRIQLKQGDVREIFLSYVMVDGKRTFFQAIKDGRFRALLPEKIETS